MNIKKLINKHKGYLLTSISVVVMYSFGYIMQNKTTMPIDDLLYVVPVAFCGVLLFSIPFRLMFGDIKLKSRTALLDEKK